MSKADIDKALGLGAGGIDEFLSDIEVDSSPDKLQEQLDAIGENVKTEVQKIDD